MNNARALAVRSAQLYRSEVPHWTKLNPKRTEAPQCTTLGFYGFLISSIWIGFADFQPVYRRLKLGCKSRQSRDHLLCGGHYLDGLVWQCALTYLLVRSPCFSQRPNEPMSVAFTKEEDNEAAAAYLPERPISPHPNLVTASGLAKLDAALTLAKDAVALAQTNADLKNDRNAMARAARDLRYFSSRRASAQLFEPTGEPDLVIFGRQVTFRRDDGRTQSFRIVGEDEADAAQGMISHISPIAKALLGKRVGDITTLNDSELEVISVE